MLPEALLLLIVAVAALAYLRPWETDSARPGSLPRQDARESLPRQAEDEALAQPGAEPEFGPEKPPAPAGPEEGSYELSAVTVPPRPINIPEVRQFLERNYPPHLRDARVQGTVQVRFLITSEGRVEGRSVHVTLSSDTEFTPVAIRAAEQLRFSPAQVDGRPVRVWAELPIQFQIW